MIDGPMLPTVSVIVPTHGRPGQIRKCVEALRSLDYPPSALRIVVVNDGGPPPDLEGPGDAPEITVIAQERQGPAVARNRGATEASGEVLAFTDDDCRPRRDWLRRLVAALEEDPDSMVGGRTLNGLTSNIWARASQDLVSFLYEAFAATRSLRAFMTTNNLAVRRDRFLLIDGFDDGFPLPAAEDRDLCERWADRIGPLRIVPDAIVDHYHRLNAWSFVRQHYGYGRGAVQLARRRRARDSGVPVPEPLMFYMRMFAYPFHQHPGLQGLAASALVVLSQICGLTGMAHEAASMLWRRQPPIRLPADADPEATAELVRPGSESRQR